MVSHDDINRAFASDEVLNESEDRLFQYLRLLCHMPIHSDVMQLLASNRAITLNAILMRRFIGRENRRTTLLTWVVIVLAGANVVGIGLQLWLARS